MWKKRDSDVPWLRGRWGPVAPYPHGVMKSLTAADSAVSEYRALDDFGNLRETVLFNDYPHDLGPLTGFERYIFESTDYYYAHYNNDPEEDAGYDHFLAAQDPTTPA